MSELNEIGPIALEESMKEYPAKSVAPLIVGQEMENPRRPGPSGCCGECQIEATFQQVLGYLGVTGQECTGLGSGGIWHQQSGDCTGRKGVETEQKTHQLGLSIQYDV